MKINKIVVTSYYIFMLIILSILMLTSSKYKSHKTAKFENKLKSKLKNKGKNNQGKIFFYF
jgi:hypothetical protein